MTITDGKKTTEITMKVWDVARNEWKYAGENLANDFFNVGALPISNEGVYVVSDVDYCIEEAQDWEQCIGDHRDDDGDGNGRILAVEDHDVTAEDIACVLRHSGEWDMDLCAELCKMADMADEWEAADDTSYEDVLDAAAHKLDVELYQHD